MDWPREYLLLRDSGALEALNSPRKSLVPDVYFFPEKQARKFKPEKDQVISIQPFGKSASGDLWAFQKLDTIQSPVLACFHDDRDAEFVANDVISFAYYRTVLFFSELPIIATGWTMEESQRIINDVADIFRELWGHEATDALISAACLDKPVDSTTKPLINRQTGKDLTERFAPCATRGKLIRWME